MNLDSTGLRLVKKGKRVRRTLRGKTIAGDVTKVNRGQARVLWEGHAYATAHFCHRLEVVDRAATRGV